jgi:hypothetical protein
MSEQVINLSFLGCIMGCMCERDININRTLGMPTTKIQHVG